jgi:L-fuculokinase
MASNPDINESLKERSGVSPFYFNTVYKLLWLKQNRPDVMDDCDRFVFISSMINHKLTGEFTTDTTMLGTSMLTDHRNRSLCENSLRCAGLKGLRFPRTVEAGDLLGLLTTTAAQGLGLSPSIPVVSAGHDTQFAIIGSGAGLGQAVLSSGTWDILMARVSRISEHHSTDDEGFTTELDAVTGVLNPGVQWIASGFLEWITAMIYADLKDDPKRYDKMILEAKQANSRGESVCFENDFLAGQDQLGVLNGLHLGVSRGAIYAAALRHLAKRLTKALLALEDFSGFKASHLTCVGGGAKNPLLNQLRANAIRRPIHVVQESECTAIGSSMFGLISQGVYSDIESAQNEMKPAIMVTEPS